ncbi:hypothetical protein IFM89_038482 [Coptis chinensis]|uniref:Disease resistance protein n=1 Tax=Coptis chinensis TaxID=261450 RepID=A0A835LHU5_9MAGN|nr:hypothetical protein IFM89_038482 [Coptis chinensis]
MSFLGDSVVVSSLQRLELHICPKLRLPMPLPSSIKQLTLERWNDPLLNSVETLPNLSSLCVIGFDEVETFSEAPLQNLRSLETLIIWECYTLTRLPTELENLTTLRILKIYFCGGLESLTEGLRNLASLKELVIGHCQSLKSLSESSLQQLTTLETLTFSHCPNLEIFSVGFQNLIALRSLTLDCLPQLTSLPKELRHSPRLLLLRTKNCKNLKTLPKWLLNLPTLYFLDIIGCHPELHKRCKDWTGAAHLRVVNEELSL